MKDNWRERGITTLCGLTLVAILYSGWLASHATLTGTRTLDGVISVLLGLYICSHPAANAVDLLFFQHEVLRQAASEWPGIGWLALNLLVLLLGWIVIFMGTTRLVGEMP
jgi:hypothetical protein